MACLLKQATLIDSMSQLSTDKATILDKELPIRFTGISSPKKLETHMVSFVKIAQYFDVKYFLV